MIKKRPIKDRLNLVKILQSAGGKVTEDGKNLLIGFDRAIEVLDGGNRLKVSSTNEIDVGEYGFRVDDGFPEENMGDICLIPKIYSISLPVSCGGL